MLNDFKMRVAHKNFTLCYDSKVKFPPSSNVRSQKLVFAARRPQRLITKELTNKIFSR